MAARTLSSLLTAVLCLSACEKEGRTTNISMRDAGPMDAKVDDDASMARDAAPDAQSGDASQDDDAGPSEPFDPAKDCEVVAEKAELALSVSFGDESGYAITPGLTGFGVAYQSDRCGAIGVLPVASTGAYPQPTVLYDSCSTVAQGVSLLHLPQGYRLTWVDNASGSSELQTLQLSDGLGRPADDTRLSLTSNQLRELMPVQASLGTRQVVSWISDSGASGSQAQRAIMLRMDGAEDAQTIVADDAGFHPTKLALAQLGQDSGALAFVSEQAQAGVWLVPLTGDASARQAPVRLSGAVSAGNTVDLATREEDGGAVIYSLDIGGRQEVRFRRLSATGTFLSDEVKVVTFPLEGRDASIARLGGGYVVAFRSMTESGATRGEVRLTFVSKEGNLQKDSAGRVTTESLGPASATGGRVTARISRDGQLLVGFLDVDAESSQGPQFRLVRRRLDCAL